MPGGGESSLHVLELGSIVAIELRTIPPPLVTRVHTADTGPIRSIQDGGTPVPDAEWVVKRPSDPADAPNGAAEDPTAPPSCAVNS